MTAIRVRKKQFKRGSAEHLNMDVLRTLTAGLDEPSLWCFAALMSWAILREDEEFGSEEEDKDFAMATLAKIDEKQRDQVIAALLNWRDFLKRGRLH